MRKLLSVVLFLSACGDIDGPNVPPPTGGGETFLTGGEDPDNPFFQALGTNGRRCASCHAREAGWSITPTAIQAAFDASDGTDPLFRTIDGATSPRADVSTLEARRAAYALLLTRGLIRVAQPLPTGAEFTLTEVSDPYDFASAAELSLFRRPLPSTNLRFLSQIMWDGREPALEQQAADATMGHAEASTPATDEDVARMVAFESSAYTAQRRDDLAGDLASDGARGGAQALAEVPFAVGSNEGARFSRDVFRLFAAWSSADDGTARGRRRAAIARGEQLFNTKPFRIRGVRGLEDQDGTCSTCHNTPDVGSHSVATLMDIGVSDVNRAPRELPRYTLTRTGDRRSVETTDPGFALVSGRWDDVGKFKVPVLRGVAMRPPYFHNGLADDLDGVLRFYQRRFGVRLSNDERDDLVAFLSAL